MISTPGEFLRSDLILLFFFFGLLGGSIRFLKLSFGLVASLLSRSQLVSPARNILSITLFLFPFFASFAYQPPTGRVD